MSPPPVAELPPLSPGKTGWPWTIEAPLHTTFQQTRAETSVWPIISLVTPSFNQGQFIEQTIRSVLLQGYPRLEYYVMDGGSRDETVSILKNYEPWLAGWKSAKDGGQPAAINEGWRQATGEILAYVNSDDWYHPGTFFAVANAFREHPDAQWVCGQVDNCWSPEKMAKRHQPRTPSLVECLGRKNYGFHQPGMFWRRELIDVVGPFDTALQHSFCHDFWARCLLQKFAPVNVAQPFAFFRLHDTSKSCSQRASFIKEDWRVLRRYENYLSARESVTARRWLKEYEGEAVLNMTYRLLANRRRWQAMRQLVSRLHVLPYLNPPRLGLGVLYRTFITGSPPNWFCS